MFNHFADCSASGTSRLVTAAPVDLQGMDFGISVSDSPYSGEVSVTTKFSDRYWFHNSKYTSCSYLNLYLKNSIFFLSKLGNFNLDLASRNSKKCEIYNPNNFTCLTPARD